MKKTTITALLASALVLSPALADDKVKKTEQKPAPAQQQKKQEKKAEKKQEKKAAPKVDKKCLDEEIQNLESALDNIGKSIGQRMEKQTQQLAQSQASLAKAKAECDELRKKLAASEANSKRMTQEFTAFKTTTQKQQQVSEANSKKAAMAFTALRTATQKQQQASMATLAKAGEASKGHEQMIAQLKKKNATTEAHCKAACERLKAIVGNLKKVEEELAAAKN